MGVSCGTGISSSSLSFEHPGNPTHARIMKKHTEISINLRFGFIFPPFLKTAEQKFIPRRNQLYELMETMKYIPKKRKAFFKGL
jgi:hypothetical protein